MLYYRALGYLLSRSILIRTPASHCIPPGVKRPGYKRQIHLSLKCNSVQFLENDKITFISFSVFNLGIVCKTFPYC